MTLETKFRKKTVKIGNSLGVIIPDALVFALGIEPGAEYEFSIKAGEKKEGVTNERNPENNDIRTETGPFVDIGPTVSKETDRLANDQAPGVAN